MLLLCSFICLHKGSTLLLASCLGRAALLEVGMKVKVALLFYFE